MGFISGSGSLRMPQGNYAHESQLLSLQVLEPRCVKSSRIPCVKRDTDIQNRLLDSVRKGEGGMFRENSIKTCILSRVKQITSPGWMHETSARGWCTGKTQRDGVEREVGGEIGMGNTCKSMADSCQCMVKTTTIL